MDFLALVIMAFWPVICPSSCAAVSSSLAFWLASPRPMFTVIFGISGTAILFFQPKRFISAGTVSLRYFSCNRLFIAFLRLVSNSCRQTTVITCPAWCCTAGSCEPCAVRQNRVADAGVLAATGADHHHIGNVDGSLFFHDAALDVFRRIRARVALDDVGVLDDHAVLARVDREHAAAFAARIPA